MWSFWCRKGQYFRALSSPSVKHNASSNPYSLTRREWKRYRGRSDIVATIYTCMREVPGAKLGWDTGYPE
jgi:hypothetical protein